MASLMNACDENLNPIRECVKVRTEGRAGGFSYPLTKDDVYFDRKGGDVS